MLIYIQPHVMHCAHDGVLCLCHACVGLHGCKSMMPLLRLASGKSVV